MGCEMIMFMRIGHPHDVSAAANNRSDDREKDRPALLLRATQPDGVTTTQLPSHHAASRCARRGADARSWCRHYRLNLANPCDLALAVKLVELSTEEEHRRRGMEPAAINTSQKVRRIHACRRPPQLMLPAAASSRS